jgi:hypothetical protein
VCERMGIILSIRTLLRCSSFLGHSLALMFRSRAVLELENLALRHQIAVLYRSARRRFKLTPADRLLWVSQLVLNAIIIAKMEPREV